MAYPTTLDDLDASRGTASQKLNSPSHSTHHTNEDAVIEALEAKVGIDSSADTSSIDYKLKSASSSDPGHKHTQSSISDATATPTASKIVIADGSAKIDGWVSASSTSVAGKVELATAAEIDTGTDTTRAIPIDQFVASKRNIRWLIFNLVLKSTNCAVDTNWGGDFISPISGTILQSDTTPFYIYATNSTAGTTGNMIVDVNINGTSIMTTNKLSFDSTEKNTATSSTPPDLTTTALAVGDIITIDIDSIHSVAAKGLTVYIGVRE